MSQLKYCYESLVQFCNENSIELCRDYSNELIRRETRVEGKCKTDGCDEIFNKTFRELKQNMTPYCFNCTYQNALKKRQTTFVKLYGVEHALQYEEFKNKAIETNINKYGVKYITQNKDIKDKIKNTCLNNWGVSHPSKSIIIKNRKIETCHKNSGFDFPMQNQETKEKSKKTSLKNFGVEYPTQSLEIKNKIRENNLNNWGVEYTLQHKLVKQKSIETSFRKYGVKNPIQNPLIAEKALNGYKIKYYVFPSGKNVKYQGYENLAFDELILTISENEILNSRIDVPSIWYTTDDGKKHRHYVDIFIPTQNRCIEVKSEWTLKYTNSNIFIKQQAAKDLGYKYEIWVYNKKGDKINCYE
jgi:hypothetical protein